MYWNYGEIMTDEEYAGLIETWDVLKLDSRVRRIMQFKINRNMRCIEILPVRLQKG